MEKFKITMPEDDKIISTEDFVADQILPIMIRIVDETKMVLLLCLAQDSTESCKYVQILYNASSDFEMNFIKSLTLVNISDNPKRLELYNSIVPDLKDNLYNSDFDMKIDQEHKSYYITKAAKPVGNAGCGEILNIKIPRDNYIKFNIFIRKLEMLNPIAETVFANPKYKGIEFVNIKKIKYSGSATDISSNIVMNHYTAAAGPNDIFNFNYLSPKIKDRSLKNPILPETFVTLYGKDFTVVDIIYDDYEDCFILIYEIRSEITNQYKCTKALRLYKDIYDRTNLMDNTKIYNEKVIL